LPEVHDVIKFDIVQAARRAGISSSYELQNAMDWHPSMAVRVWKGDIKRVDLDTLEALCDKFNCTPNDLLPYEPTNKKAKIAKKSGNGNR
jgi:DNA-binding Xre family transcriptional regulator